MTDPTRMLSASARPAYIGFLFQALASTNALAQPPAPIAAQPDEASFLTANAIVMNKMMVGMATKPAGDVDADFVNMMEPHHQGAIEMAELELRYGGNERLRRIAQEIIVDQQQEIAAMRLALGRALPPSEQAPTQGSAPPPTGTTEQR